MCGSTSAHFTIERYPAGMGPQLSSYNAVAQAISTTSDGGDQRVVDNFVGCLHVLVRLLQVRHEVARVVVDRTSDDRQAHVRAGMGVLLVAARISLASAGSGVGRSDCSSTSAVSCNLTCLGDGRLIDTVRRALQVVQ